MRGGTKTRAVAARKKNKRLRAARAARAREEGDWGCVAWTATRDPGNA